MNGELNEDRIPVGEIKTGGTVWQVYFDARTHRFWAASPGFTDVSGRDWDEVDRGVRVIVGKAKVKVFVHYAVVSWDGDRPVLVPGTAHGIHAGNGNVLATQGGRARSLPLAAYGRDGYMTPFAEAEAERYLDLLARRRTLDEMIKVYETDHRWGGRNLRAEVERLVEEARVAAAEAGES